MLCPTCGRATPDASAACRHCGASTRPGLWRRMFGWASRRRAAPPPVRETTEATEEPIGIEMPAAGARAVSFSVSRVTGAASSEGASNDAAAGPGADPVPRGIPAELLAQLREAAGGDGVLRYERVEHLDGAGDVSVSERGSPLDPNVRAAIEKLLESESATREQQIVIEVDGNRQVYRSLDDVPPRLRPLLGRFADAPIDDGSA